MKRFNKLLGLCMIICLSLVAFGCGNKEADASNGKDKQNTNLIPVETEKVQQGSLTKYLVVSGNTEAKSTVSVTPKISGAEKVTSLLIKEGQKVDKGVTLAILDQSTISIQLEQAQIAFEDAKKNYERTKTLSETGAVPRSELEKVETAYKNAQNNFNLQQIAYSNTIIKAPVKGIVTNVNVEEGTLVSGQTEIVTLANIDTIEVNSFVNENKINKLKEGDKVNVLIPSVSNEVYEGKIESISSVSDASKKAYPVKVVLDNKKNEIKAGMYAQVEFTTNVSANVLKVPRRAVIIADGEKKVFVVEEGKAVMKKVETGINTGTEIEITKGLSKDSEIIVVGNESVVEGDLVKVVSRGEKL